MRRYYEIEFIDAHGNIGDVRRTTIGAAAMFMLEASDNGAHEFRVLRHDVEDATAELAEFVRVRRAMQDPAAVFVFGSNIAGRHVGGAALTAAQEYGAEEWQGHGLAGRSYAIPTMVSPGREALSLQLIGKWVRSFLKDAAATPDRRFIVTKIGCGVAGFTEQEIAPLFAGHPANVELPLDWAQISEQGRYDICDECGEVYPPDARDSIGPWHADHCSRNSRNTV